MTTTRTPEDEAQYQGYLERARLTTAHINELLSIVSERKAILMSERGAVSGHRDRNLEAAAVYRYFDTRLWFLDEIEEKLQAHRIILPDYRP